LKALLLGIQKRADERLSLLRQSIAARSGDRRDVGDDCEFVQEEVAAHTAAAQAEMAHDQGVQAREALQALERGRYGVCSACDGEIPLKRLRAVPFATECLPCREAAEMRSTVRAPQPLFV